MSFYKKILAEALELNYGQSRFVRIKGAIDEHLNREVFLVKQGEIDNLSVPLNRRFTLSQFYFTTGLLLSVLLTRSFS